MGSEVNACDMEKSAENYFRSMADEKHGQLTRGNCIPPTTNDSQAPYHPTFKIPAGPHPSNPNVVKAQQREPLLSDDQITDMSSTAYDYTQSWLAMDKARAFYEAKITSGELRVVKKVNVNDLKDAEFTEFSGVFQQCTCGATLTEPMNFCPGCGSEIVGG